MRTLALAVALNVTFGFAFISSPNEDINLNYQYSSSVQERGEAAMKEITVGAEFSVTEHERKCNVNSKTTGLLGKELNYN